MTDASLVSPDTEDIAQLVARFLAAVSFEIGQVPGYTVLPGLFVAGAQLIRNSGERPEIATVDEFVHARVAHVSSGLVWFKEEELGHHTQTFGRVGHRFTIYRKQGEDADGAFDVQGCISTQVVHTPAGWRISAMAWDDERPGLSVGSAALTDRTWR
jgi:hypothetical protein